MIEIKVPYLGESDVKVVSVLKNKGDVVKAGEPLVELETEKTVFVIESEMEGIIEKIAVDVGDSVKPGDTLVILRPVG